MKKHPDFLSGFIRLLLLTCLYVYTRYLTLFFAPRCRFYPSCSRYAYDAVYSHGVSKGLYLALRRLSKCHPWHEGGIDPVPDSQMPPHISFSDACKKCL